MKTSIIIKGQIGGNFTLSRLCQTHNSELKKLPFNNFEIKFKTKKEAVKALSEAYQHLKQENADKYNSGDWSYQRGEFLQYDASEARIFNPDVF